MAKIRTHVAYEQARRALRGECEPRSLALTVVRARYSTAQRKEKRPSNDGLFSLYKGYEKDIFAFFNKVSNPHIKLE